MVTGAATWRTWTWILLTVSLLLSIALVTMIMYQMSQRMKYQHLDGNNHPERYAAVAQPVIHQRYMNEGKSLTPQSSKAVALPYTETQHP
ncbi:hypothetical protein KIN20_009107 [Parelaphostrongylus tenuis]|uniref:Uncharacterized protein n=1 Tax=Parelaphostrongylus tenuis TaxID=148309 RepID=A0AAD5QL24_PARTN|nr:hypothetical protein KIN20_009107 [Parelaphostrongylus tenuis]